MAVNEKIRTVILAFRRPGADAIEHVEVPVYAAARGLVLHPPMNGLGQISEFRMNTPYALSAVPSGRRIARFNRPEDAQGAMDELAVLLDWSRVQAEADVPGKMMGAIFSILSGRNACWSMYDACSAFKGLTSPERGAPTAHRIGLVEDAAAKMAEHAERVVVAMRDLQVAARLDTAKRLEGGDGGG